MYESRYDYDQMRQRRISTSISSEAAVYLCRNSNKKANQLKNCMTDLMYESHYDYDEMRQKRIRTDISAEAAANACV